MDLDGAATAVVHQVDLHVIGVRDDAADQLLDGVRYVGAPDSALWERVWYRPTITPIGMDVPSTTAAGNTLLAEVTTKLEAAEEAASEAEAAASEAEMTAEAEAEVEVEEQVEAEAETEAEAEVS